MKQKIVLEVNPMERYGRKKALPVAARFSGVTKATTIGGDKRQLEVIGDDVDIPELTNLLRKKVGYAKIVSVGPHPPPPDKKQDNKPKDKQEDKKPPQSLCSCQHQPCVCGCHSMIWMPMHPQLVCIEEQTHCQEPWCAIM